MRLHVASQHGVDSSLITLLPSKPFEEIGVEANRDRLLRFRHYHLRGFPEIAVGRTRLKIGLDRPPDLAVRQGADALPIATLLGGCYSSTLLFHVALPSRLK